MTLPTEVSPSISQLDFMANHSVCPQTMREQRTSNCVREQATVPPKRVWNTSSDALHRQ